MTALAKALATNREAVEIRVTKSGRFMVHVARPNRSGGSAEAANYVETIVYVGIIRHELDNNLPLVRGPAADPQEHNR